MKLTLNYDPKTGTLDWEADTVPNYAEMTDILASLQYSIMQSTTNSISSEAKLNDVLMVKERLFDIYNEAASSVLHKFLPNHLTRDLQEEAILELESKKLSTLANKQGKGPDFKPKKYRRRT